MQTRSLLLPLSSVLIVCICFLQILSCSSAAPSEFTGNTIQHESNRRVEIDALFLKAQVEILAKKEIQKMREFGIDKIPNLRVLDVGCGPGYFAIELLKQFPNIQEVVCMDIDPLFVQFAKEKVAPTLKQEEQSKFTVIQGSIFDSTEFTKRNNFDLVLARLVYQHIRRFGNVDVATKNLVSVLKPGGRIIVTDSDSRYQDVVEPEVEKWMMLHEAAEKHLNHEKLENRDKESGRKLYKDLKPFVTNLTVDIVTGVIDGETKQWFPYIMDMMDYMLLTKKKLIDASIYKEAKKELKEWIANPDSYALTHVCFVTGQRQDSAEKKEAKNSSIKFVRDEL